MIKCLYNENIVNGTDLEGKDLFEADAHVSGLCIIKSTFVWNHFFGAGQ